MSEFDIFTLSNGIRCVHRHVDSPIAHIALTIGAGTRDELPSEHGVAHLVEHLMFKGTSSRTANNVNSLLEGVGGELNAFTSKEETVLYATCMVNFVAKGTDLLCDMAFNSTFTSPEIDKEREVIIDEINSYRDSPSELIFDDFEELLFHDSSLGRNILGSKRNLKQIVRDDLINFTAKNYRTSNMVFTASSSLTNRKFRLICEKVFGKIASSSTPDVTRQIPPKDTTFDIVRNKRAHQTHTLLGGYAYSAFDERRLALSLLLNILGGPSSMSKLNMLLREKYALTYSIEASYTPFVDSGIFTLYFSAESSKVARAERLLFDEIKKLQSSKMRSDELNRWKKQFVGQLLLSAENIEQSMLSIAKSMLLYGEFDSNETIIEKINAITAGEILEVACEILDTSNISKLAYN